MTLQDLTTFFFEMCVKILENYEATREFFTRWIGAFGKDAFHNSAVYDAIADVRKSADEIQTLIIGIQRGIAISKAIDSVEKTHNIPLQSLKELFEDEEATV